MRTDWLRLESRPRFHCQGPAAAGYTSSACCALVWPQKPAATTTAGSGQRRLPRHISEKIVSLSWSSLVSYFIMQNVLTRTTLSRRSLFYYAFLGILSA